MIRNAVRTAMLLLTLTVLGVRLLPLFLGASGGSGLPLQPPGMALQAPGIGSGPQNPMGLAQEDLIRMLMAMRQNLGQSGMTEPIASGHSDASSSQLPQIRPALPPGDSARRGPKLLKVGE